MLLVLASRHDASAASLVRRWRGHDARLLTCEALSRRGWSWEPRAPDAATLVVDDERVPIASIRGAVSLLAGVVASELPHIVAGEREYVASEMGAFLVAWLSSLPCRVINRPTPLCLTGPRLHHEQWLREAACVGLPVVRARRRVVSYAQRAAAGIEPRTAADGSSDASGPAATVAVVAGRCVPTQTHPSLSDALVSGLSRLADRVGAGLLTASFAEHDGGLRFAGAAPTVDVSRDEVADAVLEAFGLAP